jgi:L-ascorbate metabolism protein UlaG (beta-lactamase superfamily)
MRHIVRTGTMCLAAAAALSTGAAPALGQAAPTGAPPASVTYIGNSGFLIRAGGKAILIDALFDGFPGGYVVPSGVREPLLAGRAPYDGIDLILATHDHADHFSAAAVRRVLASNPRAVFVGPVNAAAALADVGGRARALDPAEGRRAETEVEGIRVEAMRLSHGTPPAGVPDIGNLGYLVTVGGMKFFHTGDIDYQIVTPALLASLGIPDEHVDVAFVPHFYLGGPGPIPFVVEGLRPRFVVASHLQYTDTPVNGEQIRRNFPNAVLLWGEGERWTVPAGTSR